MRDALAATERELAAERKQLEDAERRGRLAAAVPDPETVAVAERYAIRHRERVAVLERKILVQRTSSSLAERELAEMERGGPAGDGGPTLGVDRRGVAGPIGRRGPAPTRTRACRPMPTGSGARAPSRPSSRTQEEAGETMSGDTRRRRMDRLYRAAGAGHRRCRVSCSSAALPAQQPVGAPAHLRKLAHTYSIVAYDSATGDLGVAVQSKFPNVGGIVPWGRAGVGRWRRRAWATRPTASADSISSPRAPRRKRRSGS